MRYRALAFDLDGTLLTPAEVVSPRNRAAIEAAQAAGFEIIIASARWMNLAAHVARDVRASPVVIACSGAQVRRLTDGHDLLDLHLPAAFTEDLFALCDTVRCIATVSAGDRVVVKMEGARAATADGPEEMEFTESLAAALTGAHPRIALVQGTDAYARILADLAPRWAEFVRFVESTSSRGKPILTITAAGADKGVALAVACAELAIEPEEVVAFGDADNDIEMFRVAGAAVVMGQAKGHVRDLATFVTETCENDGVAVAVERLLERGDVA